MNAFQVRALVVRQWLVGADFTNICFETCWPGFESWTADILALDHKGFLTEVEIKVSMSDMRADAKKELKHELLRAAVGGEAYPHLGRMPARIFYALPFSIEGGAVQVIREEYPYAGILIVKPDGKIRTRRGATRLHNVICDPSDLRYLELASSRTLGRLLGLLCDKTR